MSTSLRLALLCLCLAGCVPAPNEADMKLACDLVEQQGLEQNFKGYQPPKECTEEIKPPIAAYWDMFGVYHPRETFTRNYNGNGPRHTFPGDGKIHWPWSTSQ